MSEQKGSNEYIPKFIKQTPWYKEGQEEEVKDHSFSKHGEGFSDKTYDSKRDRWEGYEIRYDNDELKGTNGSKDSIEHEDEDTDYELELRELGLERQDIKINSKQDKQEKVLRDRSDVPSYIKGIKSAYNDNEWEKSSG